MKPDPDCNICAGGTAWWATDADGDSVPCPGCGGTPDLDDKPTPNFEGEPSQ